MTGDDEESVVSEMTAATAGAAGAAAAATALDVPATPSGTSTGKAGGVPVARVALSLSMDRVEIRVLDDATSSSEISSTALTSMRAARSCSSTRPLPPCRPGAVVSGGGEAERSVMSAQRASGSWCPGC